MVGEEERFGPSTPALVREGWDAAFAAMAQAGDDAPVWTDMED